MIAALWGASRSGASHPALRVEGTYLVCPLVSAARILKLAVTGTAAGLFSGLFGVGGGTVIVPLLVLWLGYGERQATGTSLAAIVVVAVIATVLQGAYGNVDVLKAALVGVPAVGGAVFGTWIQQRISTETIGLLFALLLIGVAVDLIVS
jgi:uncharacterized membrane protein YfcA